MIMVLWIKQFYCRKEKEMKSRRIFSVVSSTWMKRFYCCKEKEMKSRRIFGVVSSTMMVVLLAILTIALACAPAEKPAPPKEKVKVVYAEIPNTTGAYAAAQSFIPDMSKAIIDYINESNYIPGVEIVQKWLDGGTDTAKAVTAYKRLSSETPKPAVMVIWATPHSIALKDQFHRDEIPHIVNGFHNDYLDPQRWIFVMTTDYPSQCGAWVDWFLENWKGSTPPKFAELTWDNAFGRGQVTPEVAAYIESKGVEIVAREYIPMVPADTTTHLLRIKEGGADFAFGGMYASSLAVVLKDMDKLGILGKVKIGMAWPLIAPELIDYVGAKADGVSQVSIFEIPDRWPTLAPRVQELYLSNKELFDKVTQTRVPYVAVYNILAADAIKAAAEKVGAENVNGRAVYDQLITFKDYNYWGLGQKTTWSETQRLGGQVIGISEIKDGKVTSVAENLRVPSLYEGGKDVPKK